MAEIMGSAPNLDQMQVSVPGLNMNPNMSGLTAALYGNQREGLYQQGVGLQNALTAANTGKTQADAYAMMAKLPYDTAHIASQTENTNQEAYGRSLENKSTAALPVSTRASGKAADIQEKVTKAATDQAKSLNDWYINNASTLGSAPDGGRSAIISQANALNMNNPEAVADRYMQTATALGGGPQGLVQGHAILSKNLSLSNPQSQTELATTGMRTSTEKSIADARNITELAATDKRIAAELKVAETQLTSHPETAAQYYENKAVEARNAGNEDLAVQLAGQSMAAYQRAGNFMQMQAVAKNYFNPYLPGFGVPTVGSPQAGNPQQPPQMPGQPTGPSIPGSPQGSSQASQGTRTMQINGPDGKPISVQITSDGGQQAPAGGGMGLSNIPRLAQQQPSAPQAPINFQTDRAVQDAQRQMSPSASGLPPVTTNAAAKGAADFNNVKGDYESAPGTPMQPGDALKVAVGNVSSLLSEIGNSKSKVAQEALKDRLKQELSQIRKAGVPARDLLQQFPELLQILR